MESYCTENSQIRVFAKPLKDFKLPGSSTTYNLGQSSKIGEKLDYLCEELAGEYVEVECTEGATNDQGQGTWKVLGICKPLSIEQVDACPNSRVSKYWLDFLLIKFELSFLTWNTPDFAYEVGKGGGALVT